jgi:hypothetical protein
VNMKQWLNDADRGNPEIVVLPSPTYLFTVCVEVFYFHLIILTHTHTHTPQSIGLLWTRDRSVAETST